MATYGHLWMKTENYKLKVCPMPKSAKMKSKADCFKNGIKCRLAIRPKALASSNC